MKNVTLSLEEDVARWARIRAAEKETSVSRLVGEMLREQMVTEEGYQAARERFFSIRPRPMRDPSTPLPSRDELHDRPGFP